MSDYVKQLALSHDPFVATARYRAFFAGADRDGLLQRLIEQAHYGAPISIVSGGLGIGKSTLSREFQKSFSEEAFCIHVQATLFMNQGQFLDAVLEQLPIGASSPEVADIVRDLCQFAERLYLDAKTLVLIVDDAHELAGDVLNIIDSLTEQATEGAIHILLLGEKQLGNMLGNVMGPRAFGRVIEEELTPMSADDAEAYVRLKLADAGYTGEIPVEAAEIGALCNESNGVPGSFNIQFAKALAESLKHNKVVAAKPKNVKSLFELGAPYWATAAILLFFMFTLVIFTSPDQDEAEAALAGEEQTTTRINLPVAAMNTPGVAAPVPAEPVATSLLAETSQPEESKEEQVAPTTNLESSMQVTQVGESAAELIVAPTASATTQADTPQEPPLGSKLLSYPAENFTVQIMGSRSEDNVRRFIDQQLAAFNAQYFETRHQDRPWFVVVMGNFVSRDVASRAIADLPVSIRRMDPFIRQLGEVQSDIRKYRQH